MDAVTAGPARPRRRRRGGSLWVPAVLVAALFHAGAWLLPPPAAGPVGGAAVPAPPVVRLLPPRTWADVAAGSSTDALITWSPTLFSQPSIRGFSGAQVTPTVAARLPATPPMDFARRHAEAVRPLAVSSPSSAVAVAGAAETLALPPPPPPEALAVHLAARPAPPVLCAEWRNASGAVQRVALPSDAPLAVLVDRQPWDVEALVTCDDGGYVLHAFLERRTALPERNEAALRAVGRLRLAGLATGTYHRVRVRFTPPPPEKTG